MQTAHNISKTIHLILLFSSPTYSRNRLTPFYSQAHAESCTPSAFPPPPTSLSGDLQLPEARVPVFFTFPLDPTQRQLSICSFTHSKHISMYYSPSE